MLQINVPQAFAPSVVAGADVKMTLRQFLGRAFPGKVARTSGGLDPASRTLRREVDVPNDKGELLAGMRRRESAQRLVEQRRYTRDVFFEAMR